MSKKQEHYSASLKAAYVFAGLFSLLLFLGYLDSGFTDGLRRGSIVALGFVALVFVAHGILSYIKILDRRILKYSSEGRVRTVLIDNITRIERTRQFHVFKNSGSYLRLVFFDKDLNERRLLVRENLFHKKTLKAVIQKLLEIKPTIQIGKQYQDLIDGMYDEKNFHGVAAETLD